MTALLHAAVDRGITFFDTKGFLTGKIDENTQLDSTDFRNTIPRFAPEARKANQALVDLLSNIAKRKNATPAQMTGR
jgi:aryl-alcohol dehydrogenase-like predicted oxidoreductase